MAGGILTGSGLDELVRQIEELRTRRYEGAFDEGLEAGTPLGEAGAYAQMVAVCEDVLWLYGVYGDGEPVDVLGIDRIVEDLPRIREGRRALVIPRDPETPWHDAGVIVRYGLRVDMLAAETGPEGQRMWRLLTHEQTWIKFRDDDGRTHYIQVRGLPPVQQAARHAYEAEVREAEAVAAALRSARPRGRVARSYLELDAAVEPLLRKLLVLDPDALVGHALVRIGALPPEFRTARVDAAVPTLAAHHRHAGFDVATCLHWLRVIRRRVAAVEAAGPKPPPSDDANALGSLAW